MNLALILTILIVLVGVGGVAIVTSVGARKAKPSFVCLLCDGIDPTARCECLYGCGALACQAYAIRVEGL